NAGENGKPRKLGLVYTTDPSQPGLQDLAAQVRRDVTACGGTIADEATFPTVGLITANPDAAPTMARFHADGITTILWAGGLDTTLTAAAGGSGYRPEWVVAGDG